MVKLIDGSEVASDSEAWRHQCEAAHIAALPTLEARRDWLEKINRKRGAEAGDSLRRTMKALWRGKPETTKPRSEA